MTASSEIMGLSEYVSRWARWRLVKTCVDGLHSDMRGEGGRVRRSPVGAFASMCGVTPRTVERWLANGVQSCNVNAERIIELAVELSPAEAERILREDIAHHQEELKGLLDGGRQGGVAPLTEVNHR
jgi:hypothetical protein